MITWTKASVLLVLLVATVRCTTASSQKAVDLPLKAPVGAPRSATAAIDAGNALLEGDQWEQARAQYELALTADPTMAEAHYDLALALDRLGKKNEAIVHYRKAADLAPGNRVIWNAPPFRQVDAEVGKSRMEKRLPRVDPQRPY